MASRCRVSTRRAKWRASAAAACTATARSKGRSSAAAFSPAGSPVARPPPRCAEVLGLLLRDDLVLDAVVDVLRDDLLVHEVVLALVGTARDDRGRAHRADARQCIELLLGGAVD